MPRGHPGGCGRRKRGEEALHGKKRVSYSTGTRQAQAHRGKDKDHATRAEGVKKTQIWLLRTIQKRHASQRSTRAIMFGEQVTRGSDSPGHWKKNPVAWVEKRVPKQKEEPRFTPHNFEGFRRLPKRRRSQRTIEKTCPESPWSGHELT